MDDAERLNQIADAKETAKGATWTAITVYEYICFLGLFIGAVLFIEVGPDQLFAPPTGSEFRARSNFRWFMPITKFKAILSYCYGAFTSTDSSDPWAGTRRFTDRFNAWMKHI